MDDEELLTQAEEALTEIKVAHGLSDRHASVLAALRIRLKGSAGKSLEHPASGLCWPASRVMANRGCGCWRSPGERCPKTVRESPPKTNRI